VPAYDCIEYNRTGDGSSAVTPWCFTADGGSAACRLLTCSQGVQRSCPAGGAPAGSAGASELAGWAAPGCVEALCSARTALVNISVCTTDTPVDRTALVELFSTLDGSASFTTALSAAGGGNETTAAVASPAPSLSGYCDANFGQLCVDTVIDPACPAVFRSNNFWMIRTGASSLCDLGCLEALCTLQHRRRHFNSSTGNACADADLEMLIR
jgi:hypothetical protein